MMYINSNSTDANFNFALEKYAMDELAISNDYFLFWRTHPTLMIGKFQNALQEINMDYVKANKVNVVRRVTGGGTIYTDMNGWQFSFITKNSQDKHLDFAYFTQPIIDALASLGIHAELSGRNDLLIDGRKFSGNAQYKTKKVNLHHGSLLFNTTIEHMVRALNVADEKLISKGIKSVKSRVTNISEHMTDQITSEAFRDLMLTYLTKEMTTYTLSPSDIDRINQIKSEQFDTWAWNYGRSPKFNLTKEHRYTGGKLSVCSYVNKGIIEEIDFYGDFFEQKDIQVLRQGLIGCPYEAQTIKDCLRQLDAGNFIYKISLEEIYALII